MTITGSLLLVLLLPGLASLLLPLLEAVQVLLLTSGQHLQEDGVLSSVIQTWSRTNYISVYHLDWCMKCTHQIDPVEAR